MNIDDSIFPLRWDPYFIKYGTPFEEFWKEYLHSKTRNLLYILGLGFDPRMCSGVATVFNTAGNGIRECLMIVCEESQSSLSSQHTHSIKENLNIIKELCKKPRALTTKSLCMWSGEGPGRHRISGRSAANIFTDYSDFANYTDIVIDISALPRGIYLPLIGKILYLLDHAKNMNFYLQNINLHIIVCEDTALDQNICPESIDDTASYIHGFGGDPEMEATAGIPKVWMPILGEDRKIQIERIFTLVNPDEICPVLPSPSLNPRRADELLIEYRELLFDQWHVEPKNIIYASEHNPFEAYRQIRRAISYYNKALEPLGGCKVVVSALSSKLLSIGALLAAYELKEARKSVSMAHVEARDYFIKKEDNLANNRKLYNIWLVGDCYEL